MVNNNIPRHIYEGYHEAQKHAAKHASLIQSECDSILRYSLVMAYYLNDSKYLIYKDDLIKDAWFLFSDKQPNCIHELSYLVNLHSTPYEAKINKESSQKCC